MVLVDTSVWVHHFRLGDPFLARSLRDGLVLMHPLVLGEIACGNLQRRAYILKELEQLPLAVSAEHREALGFLERNRLYGTGIGWIDVHLLASAALSYCRFWTRDPRLASAAAALKLAYVPVSI